MRVAMACVMLAACSPPQEAKSLPDTQKGTPGKAEVIGCYEFAEGSATDFKWVPCPKEEPEI